MAMSMDNDNGARGVVDANRRTGWTRAGGLPGRRLLAIVTLWLAAMGWGVSSAGAAGRYSAMLVDANTGQVLHAEAADEPRYPASLTKMMTLYLVFEQMEQGRLGPATRIRISPEAAATPPSKLGLEPGASISVADAVKALITKSANDIAVALAEHIAGDERRFAEAMTRKARELGMTKTTFRNAHGLPDREQVTTARDMLTLGLRLYDTFPVQSRLFATRSFQFAGRNHRNHNTMLDNFQGMEGIKTGYTAASGYNLVASARRDGRHVVGAVFGGASGAARNARMRVMLTRGLQRASTERTRQPLIVASRANPQAVPAPAPAKRPVPARVASARPREVSAAADQAPTLVEPPAAVVRSRPSAPAAAPPLRVAEARPPGSAATDWRSTVRIAAPVAGATSVASRLGGDLNPVARSPSTLAAQAAQLGRGATSVAAATPRQGGVQIQIGAFAAADEARQKLDAARGLSAGLAGAGTATPAVTVNGRTLYRARFTGLDAQSAAAACSDLRRRQIDCLVTQE